MERLKLEGNRKFSKSELSQFNGKNGNPAYVGYKGKVYDATDSSQWADGDHMGHLAGQDLTEEMEIAPHDEEVMRRLKVVGVLT
jgi:predicted heme/steroid binding protein